MADIEEESTQLAEEIKQLMFVFEDIIKIDEMRHPRTQGNQQRGPDHGS